MAEPKQGSNVAPKNYENNLLEEPVYHNVLPQQVCPFDGSIDTQLVASEQGNNVYYCNNCRQRFKWEQNVRSGNFAISQPTHVTDRGIGIVQRPLPEAMPKKGE